MNSTTAMQTGMYYHAGENVPANSILGDPAVCISKGKKKISEANRWWVCALLSVRVGVHFSWPHGKKDVTATFGFKL